MQEDKNNINKEAQKIIKEKIHEYKNITDSNAKVDNVINTTTLFSNSCEFNYDPKLLQKRKNLGYGQVDTTLSKLDEHLTKYKFDPESIEKSCKERIESPEISEDVATLLKEYTEFYNKGLEIYNKAQKTECPFCLRDWPNAEKKIEEYTAFIQSKYKLKRDNIRNIISTIEKYKSQVENQINKIEETRKLAEIEAKKYEVDISKWLPLQYDNKLHNEIIELLEKKYNNMGTSISVIKQLNSLQENHLEIIRINNKVINKILAEIKAISSRRRRINEEIAKHYAKEIWKENAKLREKAAELNQLIDDNKKKIEKLEEENKHQDTIRIVFNRLLEFIGLNEYFIDDNKQLKLRLEDEHDISSELKRISSAQRKILSLCYFISEIISEINTPNDLKKYILIFDDPVDSADYIYFHSITSVIEKAEVIIALILEVDKIKFGQFFVLTHNSLLHDRIICGWRCKSMSLKKENNVTVMCPGEKTINNYNEYIGIICNYYKNPVSNRGRMIYIGNLIRRVLEIIASFDTLESNSFQDILDGMGKTKLAVIANHLSHDSFSKTLNPLSESDELKEACKELLEVIKEHHPYQFETIQKRFEIEL